jgi:FMN hydrolase / 5-amino-6-(5-phospho-D-ribitylamino)uracil phosphatase
MMPRPSPRIRAVLFDLDDTLLDWSGYAGSLSAIYRPHTDKVYDHLLAGDHILPEREAFLAAYQTAVNLAWDEAKKEYTAVNFSQVLQDLFRALSLDLAAIDLEAVLHVYDWQAVPGVTLYPDTIPVLDALRRQQYKIGLVTNSMLPMWMRDRELRTYGILEYFDVRLTSGDAGYIKPHPAIYEQALVSLDVSPEQALFVGDRPANDIAGANAAGMTSVLMAPDHLNHDLAGVQPHFTIRHLRELLPLLADL